MVFLDKWSLFGGYLFYIIRKGLLKCGLYLQGGLYSEVAFNTGLTVCTNVLSLEQDNFTPDTLKNSIMFHTGWSLFRDGL